MEKTSIYKKLEILHPEAKNIYVVCDNAKYYKNKLLNESLKNKAIEQNLHTVEKLKSFSKENKIHLSILISQLQRQERINYDDFTANKLKSKVEFEELIF